MTIAYQTTKSIGKAAASATITHHRMQTAAARAAAVCLEVKGRATLSDRFVNWSRLSLLPYEAEPTGGILDRTQRSALRLGDAPHGRRETPLQRGRHW
jgi:hypothetical protein